MRLRIGRSGTQSGTGGQGRAAGTSVVVAVGRHIRIAFAAEAPAGEHIAVGRTGRASRLLEQVGSSLQWAVEAESSEGPDRPVGPGGVRRPVHWSNRG